MSRSVTPPIKCSKGNPFTEAEGKALMDIYDDILNIDETRLIEAWETFAEEVCGLFLVREVCFKYGP